MTKSSPTKLDVDKKTAKGKGEGGFAPHPDQPTNEKAPPLDPHSYKVPSFSRRRQGAR